MKIGFFLSCEEYGPLELVRQARLAEEAGFHGLWISDHYHPWNDAQGESAFVWSVIGALSQATTLPVTTAVTCPTIRTHPAIIAHAAATAQVMLAGRFSLGVGSGEALNEHILGDRWPAAQERLDMLADAVEIMRELWRGEVVTMSTDHYDVEHARIYTLPDTPPPVIVSGFGPRAVGLAGRIGDGFATVMPDADAVRSFRDSGGGRKVVQGGTKVCFGPDEAEAVKTVHRIWPNESLPGELAQVLPTPEHFEQASQLVTEEMIAEAVPCGPDIERHAARIQEYAQAGVDELYIQQVGGGHEAFFEAFARDILPRFA
jgi:G6PDH family F420-dependent oxidoreductase